MPADGAMRGAAGLSSVLRTEDPQTSWARPALHWADEEFAGDRTFAGEDAFADGAEEEREGAEEGAEG